MDHGRRTGSDEGLAPLARLYDLGRVRASLAAAALRQESPTEGPDFAAGPNW